MRTIVLILSIFLFGSFNMPLSDTWDGTEYDQLVTGNAARNAGTIGVFIITTPIPTELNKKALTKAQLATYTSISTGSFPLSGYASNQCVSKGAILSTF